MPAIGDTLREARMRQKLDIADVEQRTKIRAKYLRALENEEFGLLPGSTFVKTFLRTYAEVLGLDPHLLVEEYRVHHEAGEELERGPLGPPAAGRREGDRRFARPRPPRWGTVVFGALAALIGFLLVLGLLTDRDTSDDDGAAGPATRTEERTRPDRPERRPRRSRRGGAVTVRLAPTVPTYACLDTGPGTPVLFEGILQRPRSFRAKILRVNLGKTSVRLVANGRTIPIEPTPNPVGYELRPSGARALPPGQRPCA